MAKETSSDQKRGRGRSRSSSYSSSPSRSNSRDPPRKRRHKSSRRHRRRDRSPSSDSSSHRQTSTTGGEEEHEREKNRKAVENRPRQWQVASDNSEHSDDEDDRRRRHRDTKDRHDRKESKKRRKKSSGRRRSRSRSRSIDSSRSRSGDRHRKHHRKHHRKESKHRKGDRKHSKKSKPDSKQVGSSSSGGGMTSSLASQNQFGKYGILKDSDFYSKQRSFEAWLAEVKQLPSFTGPRWELMNYFKEFCEDFNTVTMPHVKYYNYDTWESEEYQRQKARIAAQGGVVSDEALHLEHVRKKQDEKKKMELELVRGMMSKDKIEEMKRQAQLKQEMNVAFKTGDEQTKKKLMKRLEPEEKKMGGAAHPWAK